MKLFKSLQNWWKSPERELIEQSEPEINVSEKPYKNIYYNGSNLTIVFEDGEVLMGNCNYSVYNEIKNTVVYNDIIKLLYSADENENEEVLISKNDLNILKNNHLFIIEGNSVFIGGICLPIPPIILASFIEILERIEINKKLGRNIEELETYFESLKLFWYKLSCNPIAESRNYLLEYINDNDIKLTASGNFISYRRIVKKVTDTELVESVSKEYMRIRLKKKSTGNYCIQEHDGVYTSRKESKFNPNGEWTRIGNLKELYTNLPKEESNRYTDNYSKSYDIRIGKTYKIHEKDIDLHRNGSCGGLLHCSDGINYNYSSFGDTPVVVIVNPMHTIRIDTGNTGKIGVSQMFIAAVTTQDEYGNFEGIADSTLFEFDEEYHNETIEELEEVLSTCSFKSMAIKEYKPEVSLTDIQHIISLLKNRTVKI